MRGKNDFKRTNKRERDGEIDRKCGRMHDGEGERKRDGKRDPNATENANVNGNATVYFALLLRTFAHFSR